MVYTALGSIVPGTYTHLLAPFKRFKEGPVHRDPGRQVI
jgi:hypothetical protein